MTQSKQVSGGFGTGEGVEHLEADQLQLLLLLGRLNQPQPCRLEHLLHQNQAKPLPGRGPSSKVQKLSKLRFRELQRLRRQIVKNAPRKQNPWSCPRMAHRRPGECHHKCQIRHSRSSFILKSDTAQFALSRKF